MKKERAAFLWKRIMCAAAAFALVAAAGCGIQPTHGGSDIPSQTAATELPLQSESESSILASSGRDDPETTKATTRREDPGFISEERVRLNTFLIAIVQQNIENSETDLDEDAELVRFAFGYRRDNDAEAIVEREDENGLSCRTLTLAQVNETLELYFGRTLSPDSEDYSILNEAGEGFHCVFRDGCFWNVPPYPAEAYDFPVRFCLVDKINEESATVHFRLYRVNPDNWGEGEAKRHLPLLPMFSFLDAESTNPETKGWITRIGQGTAVLSVTGEELRLVKLTTSLY